MKTYDCYVYIYISVIYVLTLLCVQKSLRYISVAIHETLCVNDQLDAQLRYIKCFLLL